MIICDVDFYWTGTQHSTHHIKSHQNIFCGRTSAVDNHFKKFNHTNMSPQSEKFWKIRWPESRIESSSERNFFDSSAMVSLQVNFLVMLYYFSRVQYHFRHFFLSEIILNSAKIVQHSWIKPLTVWTNHHTSSHHLLISSHLIHSTVLPLCSVHYYKAPSQQLCSAWYSQSVSSCQYLSWALCSHKV